MIITKDEVSSVVVSSPSRYLSIIWRRHSQQTKKSIRRWMTVCPILGACTGIILGQLDCIRTIEEFGQRPYRTVSPKRMRAGGPVVLSHSWAAADKLIKPFGRRRLCEGDDGHLEPGRRSPQAVKGRNTCVSRMHIRWIHALHLLRTFDLQLL